MYKSNKPIYEVIVIATMSAGKSTVINALIGQELLHSANEATTATITRIHDQDHLPFFSGNAYSYENELIESNPQISAELMREWNRNEKIKTIDLAGDMRAFHNDDLDIVIYDTPGPNNSQDSNHEALTLEVINDGNYGTILYVINATQLGVQDDRELLEKILSALSNKAEKKEIIFVLNKADELDPEKGEYVDQVVKRAKAYLVDVGFKKPIIIPTVANQALACQKALNNDKLTRSAKFDLKRALVAKNEFIMAATLPKKVKTPMKNQQIFSIRDDAGGGR